MSAVTVFSAADHVYMARALRLAERGLYTTTPNPRVGCVIVHGDEVVGEGWHERAGEAHAEVHALRQAGARARGATVYVSLEPCSHHGRTPPCAHALIDAGVARVVVATPDPNPQVAGQGLQRLTSAGICVQVGLMAHLARELNIGFFSRMLRGRPWLRLKTAASLDGQTALENGTSRWITGPAARQDVQHWRARACAILTGVGTVLADDPRMNVRLPEARRQPMRVVLDSTMRTPPDARILRGGECLLVCQNATAARLRPLLDAGATVLELPGPDGRPDLRLLLEELARRGVNELHAEAGARLNGSLLVAGLVDEWVAYLAPVAIGLNARGLFDVPALTAIEQSHRFTLHDVRAVGDDLRLILRRDESWLDRPEGR